MAFGQFDERVDTFVEETFDSEKNERRSGKSTVGAIRRETGNFTFESGLENSTVDFADSHHWASDISPGGSDCGDRSGKDLADSAKSLAQWQVSQCRKTGAKWGFGVGAVSGLAMTGGILGAAIGTTIFPGVGTVAGACIGAFLGSIGLGTLIGCAVGHLKGKRDAAVILGKSRQDRDSPRFRADEPAYSASERHSACERSKPYWTMTFSKPFGRNDGKQASFAADCAQQLIVDRSLFARAHHYEEAWNDGDVPAEIHRQFQSIESGFEAISQTVVDQRRQDAEAAAQGLIDQLLKPVEPVESEDSREEALEETTAGLLDFAQKTRSYTEAGRRLRGLSGAVDEQQIHADLDRFLQSATGAHTGELSGAISRLTSADSAFRNLALAVRSLKAGCVMPQACSLLDLVMTAVLDHVSTVALDHVGTAVLTGSSDHTGAEPTGRGDRPSVSSPNEDSGNEGGKTVTVADLKTRVALFKVVLENDGTTDKSPPAVKQLLLRMPPLQFFLDALDYTPSSKSDER